MANTAAIEQARERVRWATSAAEHEAAEEDLRRLLAGTPAPAAPAAAAPAPSRPPSSAVGWSIEKKVIRDSDGLVVQVDEVWRPSPGA